MRAVRILCVAALLALGAASAGGASPGSRSAPSAFVPQALLAAAEADPDSTFEVILQGAGGARAGDVAASVDATTGGRGIGLKRRLATIDGVSAELTGKQLLRLAAKKDIYAITEDAEVTLTGGGTGGGYQTTSIVQSSGGFSTKQYWPSAAHVKDFWASSIVPSTIAVVDSGIDATRPDFAGRVVASATLTSLNPNSPGDGRGHGTLVAGIAAGSGALYGGAAPTAKLVSLDVMDDYGMARTSDVIAAADWIVQHKDDYGIGVANFSLQEDKPSSFLYDPLDKALERLWFSGVVVVAAAGNYAVDGAESGIGFAPANDPFVITVGSVDTGSTVSVTNDVPAPWSAYGYTVDGFAKPDLAAPGRYMAAPVPPSSTMALEHPERLVAPGYMWMSGTSFAAPVVSGAVALVRGMHPGWTPDQVKGALMSTASCLCRTPARSTGVGEVRADNAVDLVTPPNPNAGLNAFLVAGPAGGSTPVFDAASWNSTAAADASWNSASWNSASWNTASWNTASWNTASWNTASWNSVAWASLIWVD